MEGRCLDVLNFKTMFWEYSKKINDHMNVAFQSLFDQYDLTPLQARILVELHEHQTHTIGSLANRINMAGTNISTMCKKLEQKGLLNRVRMSEDERIVKVILTDKGIEIVEDLNRELIERITLYTKNESEQTLEDIIKGLQELDKLLHQLGSNYK